MNLIKKTQSVCPTCIKKIDAKIIEKNGKVYMLKECSEHGKFQFLVSTDADYYKKLNDFYLSLNRNSCIGEEADRKHGITFYLTLKCNLGCPICYVNANIARYNEISVDFIKNKVKQLENTRVMLFGGEPTLREDLPEIIKIVKDSGNYPILFTNGIKFTDYNYLKKLKESGLSEVHLQFDGFNDAVYKTMRNKKLLNVKLSALKNLRRLMMPTTLEVTIAKGINDSEINKILEFAIKNNFINMVKFRSYAFLGKAGLKRSKTPTIEELISLTEKYTDGKISKKKIFNFQKALYVFYNLLAVPNCYYHQYYLIFRKGKSYTTINEVLNLNKIQDNLETYSKLINKNKLLGKAYLFLSLFPKLFNLRAITFLLNSIYVFLNAKIGKPINASSLTRKMLILGLEYMCNPDTFDFECANRCVSKEIASNGNLRPIYEGHLLRGH